MVDNKHSQQSSVGISPPIDCVKGLATNQIPPEQQQPLQVPNKCCLWQTCMRGQAIVANALPSAPSVRNLRGQNRPRDKVLANEWPFAPHRTAETSVPLRALSSAQPCGSIEKVGVLARLKDGLAVTSGKQEAQRP